MCPSGFNESEGTGCTSGQIPSKGVRFIALVGFLRLKKKKRIERQSDRVEHAHRLMSSPIFLSIENENGDGEKD